jgi:hypothetical protein
VHTYPITTEGKQKKLNIIKHTLLSNEYNINIGRGHRDRNKRNKNADQQHQKPNRPLPDKAAETQK